jgi:tetratricopeptide (TPR) repeat protein
MVTEANTQTNYRYPGIWPFYDNDIDRRLFFGRDTEKEALLHKVLADNLVVLYARSGLGKTSLLNAGLSQALRDRGFIPLMVRFNDPKLDPVQGIYAGFKEIASQKSMEIEAGEDATLWQYFKTTYFWSDSNKMLTPVLILDQFEEFLTLYSPWERKGFIRQLADVVNNKVPASLLKSVKPEEPLPYSDKPPNVKAIISIREDYVGQLDEMSREIPDILHHRFRLLPLSREQAGQAIIKPSQVQDDVIDAAAFTFSTEAVDTMLDFLCKRRERGITKMTDEVESFQLQLLCRHIEDMVRERTKEEPGDIIVKKKDLGGEVGMQRVLQRFYDDQVEQLGPEVEKEKVRKLCEEGLISITDRRLSLEEEDITIRFNVPKVLLQELVNRRLLRAEPRVGSVYYELSHDTLVGPIRKSQKKRETKFNMKATVFTLIGILIVILINSIIIDREPFQSNTDIARNFLKYGNSKFSEGKFEKAIEAYEEAIKNDPKLFDPHYKKGNALRRQERYTEAIVAYQKAINIEPKYNSAKMKLLETYLMAKQFKAALEKANDYLKNVNMSNILALRFFSICSLVFQEKYQQAEEQLEEFIDFYRSIPEKKYSQSLEIQYDKDLITKFIKNYAWMPKNKKYKGLLLIMVDLLKMYDAKKERKDKKLKELEISIQETFK